MSKHGNDSSWRRGRQAFRRWRRSRPFWGGALVVAAGIEILAAPLAPLPLVFHQGISGISSYLIALLLAAIGVLCWLQPAQRFFYGIVAILLALASFLTSNLGGFVLGMLLGIVGGALVFSWAPKSPHDGPADTGADGDGDPPAPEDGGSPESEEDPDGPEASAGDAPTQRVEESEGGDTGTMPSAPDRRAHGLLAVPVALLLAVSPPATVDWPWDDWFGGGEEEEEGEPSPEPSKSPSPSSSTDPLLPEPELPGDEDGQDREDGSPEDSEEEEEEESSSEESEECVIREGERAEGERAEEDFREAVAACEAARERGETPEVTIHSAEGREEQFTAATAVSGLTADRLVMHGASFDGVVEVPTKDGPKRYLRFSMDQARFTGAQQWNANGAATTTLGIPDMEMSGDVVMHATRMEARILGIPLTFTPDFPPPLMLPTMVLTDVTAEQPLAETESLNIDGLDLTTLAERPQS